MKRLRKMTGLFTAALLTITALTGCSSQDTESVSDTANKFLAVVADDSQEDITTYATTEVATGEFVQFFDADFQKEQFLAGSDENALTDTTKQKIEEFYQLFSDMIQSYSISDVEITKGEPYSATCVATINTSFDVDITSSEATKALIKEETEKYNTDKAEEIAALSEEDPDAAQNKILNDMTMLVLDIYEAEIDKSEPMTYAMVLTLEKNSETDSWIVTKVENYDDSNK